MKNCLIAIGLSFVTASAGVLAADATKREATVGMPSVRTVVSDTNRFTCGSGPVSCLSSDGKRLFVPYPIVDVDLKRMGFDVNRIINDKSALEING